MSVYDNYAEDWAKKARSGKKLSHDFIERPAIRSILPELNGKKVLCLGCGSGEECQFLLDKGATAVFGVDSSKGLIENAKHTFPDVQFEAMDMQRLNFAAESFDLVFSSLALHYLENWKRVFAEVKKVLKPGGLFIFSVHNPVKWGAETNKGSGDVEVKLGYKRTKSGDFKIYGDYLNARKISDNIQSGLRIEFYHRPFSDMLNDIAESGLLLEQVIEPKALEGAKREKEDYWAVHQKIPMFVIFKLKKP